MKNLLYKIASVKALTPQLWQVLLRPATDDHFHYLAGQYIQLVLPQWEPRPYSLANAPQADRSLELHVQQMFANDYTNALVEHLQQQPTLLLNGPYGKCIYQPVHQYPIIFLAGGTGFAPLKAIIEQAFIDDDARPMHLFWGAKTRADLYLDELAQTWQAKHANFTYTPVLQQPDDAWFGEVGLVPEVITKQYKNLANVQIYAAGPFAMVNAALQRFRQYGFNAVNMHSDALEQLCI